MAPKTSPAPVQTWQMELAKLLAACTRLVQTAQAEFEKEIQRRDEER